ncbi:MAG: hypothetical protein WC225_06025 [Acholeplasmataceae bacterium]|nr:hypothetical protein [Acholeplasmataceae bacterium]
MKNVWKTALTTFIATLLIGISINSFFPHLDFIFIVVIIAVVAVLTIIVSSLLQYKNENTKMKEKKHL